MAKRRQTTPAELSLERPEIHLSEGEISHEVGRAFLEPRMYFPEDGRGAVTGRIEEAANPPELVLESPKVFHARPRTQ
jgi:hypothetical protein